MTTLIAKNQTGGALALPQLPVPNNEVPAGIGATVTLTDYASVDEISNDADLLAHITAGDAILNDGVSDLSAEQSEQVVSPSPSSIAGAPIHSDIDAEISTIAEKVSPVSADLVVIEDSAASNAKRRVQVGNLPGGGGGGTPVYVDYYDSGTTNIGSSATTAGLDTSRQSDALFVLAANQVTVQAGGAGDYFVCYAITFGETDSSNREVESWLEINGSEVAATRSVGSHWDEHSLVTDNTLTRSAILTLADADVIRIRAEVTNGSSGYTTDRPGGVSLQIMTIGGVGPEGPTGPTGSGSNVIVQEDGVTVGGGPHGTLNFIDCTATDAGGGVADITPATPFGKDYNMVEDTAQSTTTSSSFVAKLTLTTGALTGTYRISWSAVVGHSNTQDKVEARLRNTTDSTTIGNQNSDGIRIEPKDPNNRYPVGGFDLVVFAGVAKTFVLQFREQDGNTARIEDARIECWRTS